MFDEIWLIVGVYFVMQCYTLIAWRRGWRIAAALPLVGMIPIGVDSFHLAYHQQNRIWPFFLLPAGSLALLYLIVLVVFRTKSHE
jgi:hypothetical protein